MKDEGARGDCFEMGEGLDGLESFEGFDGLD